MGLASCGWNPFHPFSKQLLGACCPPGLTIDAGGSTLRELTADELTEICIDGDTERDWQDQRR